MEVEPFRPLKFAELRRDPAGKAIGCQRQLTHAAAGVGLDAVPGIQRCVRQPVVVVTPVRATGCFVENFKYVPIRQIFARHTRSRVRRNAVQPPLNVVILRDAKQGARIVELDQPKRDPSKRQAARQPIAADPQDGHSAQVTQRARGFAGQAVAGEIEFRDAAEGIRRDAVPFLQRLRREPRVGVPPVRAAGALIEVLQRLPVSLIAEGASAVLDVPPPRRE